MAERKGVNWSGKNAPAKAYLCTQSGQQIELLPNRVYVLGRDAECDMRMVDSGCSRRHARISVAGDVRVVWLEDLRSKNGTFHNESRVSGKVLVKAGDKIRLGNTEYVLRVTDGAVEVQFDTRTNVLGK